ncbi:CTP synthase [Candidatus Woesearchaeota archaeon]|nr:CTP synthase [Candidatus Woesearchaeota archaeon]
MGKVKYIVVTGGVLSGLGKGTITSAIGQLLKAQGHNVTAIKIDPYINVDAGTMRPTEHGEVFVTYDGGETDQDLGNYERFLDIELSKRHSITTGQVYATVIEKERNLEYGGKCVEVIPHIPQEVQRRIALAAKQSKADFCLIEIGGTVGDYQSVLFLEAVREMKREKNSMIFVHVAYLPIPKNLGEMKTKPAQHSVRELNSIGIQPDFVVARAEKPIDKVRKEKLALFCGVKERDIIAAPDTNTIYAVPLILEKQEFGKKILEKFDMKYHKGKLTNWKKFVEKIQNLKQEVKIGIVGKYFDIGDYTLEDSYVSVIESIKHASWHHAVKPVIQWLDSKDFEKSKENLKKLEQYRGIIVPGGFGGSGVEGKILAIQYCREHKIPYLGLCYGMQMAVIEFARNVCKLEGAHTTEVNPHTKHPVIDILPEQKKNIAGKHYGATMRLGNCIAKLKKGTKIWEYYGKQEKVVERHRHRYEVNPRYIEKLEQAGLVFSGQSPDRRLMEFIELPNHPYFAGTQAHPEFRSRPLKPHPLYLGLIRAAVERSQKPI